VRADSTVRRPRRAYGLRDHRSVGSALVHVGASGQHIQTDDHDPTLLSGLGPMIFAGGLGTGVDREANLA
jgi:hypothetical protein